MKNPLVDTIASIPNLAEAVRDSDVKSADLVREFLVGKDDAAWNNAISSPPPLHTDVRCIWVFIKHGKKKASVEVNVARLIETGSEDMFCYNGQKWTAFLSGKRVQCGPPKLWTNVSEPAS